ncbi:MAG: rhodanese-like domain-containing protein [Bacteroidetes bacterium]|nr:rhodanese-like domain-containing protein [Bacteroidota bacterium]
MDNKPKIQSLTPKEALSLCEKGAIMLDIRDEYLHAYKYFDVAKNINVPFEELEEKLSDLSKEDTYIIADSTGINCRDASVIMLRKGFSKIFILGGGFVEWEKGGMPFIHNINERLSGECACMLKQRQKGKKN